MNTAATVRRMTSASEVADITVEACRPADLGRFEIHRRSGSARNGRLHTNHGVLHTPALLPVVNPNIETIPPAEMWQRFGIRGLITNSYVFWKHEGLSERAAREGVHSVLGFPGVVMTDSGTFQNYVYGDVEVGVEEIVEFQRSIGVDIGTMLDVFGRPDQSREELQEAVDETVARAVPSLTAAGPRLLLNGPIQGGLHSDLRRRSAMLMGEASVDIGDSERGFAVHPIGGIVPLMEQRRYRELVDIVLAAKACLPVERPIHMFGCGHPMLFALAVAMGVDLFDSAAYALFARDGRLLSVEGTIKIGGLDEWPIASAALAGVTPEQVRRMSEAQRTAILARHNLEVSVAEIRACREAIRDGSIHALAERRSHSSPTLREAYEHLVSRLAESVRLPASDDGSAHLLEMVRSASPIRSGAEPVSPRLARQPRSLHLRALLEGRWTPPALRADGVAASGRGRIVLLHGAPPPWRESVGGKVRRLLVEDPDMLPLIWTPLGAIPYSLEDVAPWCHLDGPDDIWRFDGVDPDSVLVPLGLAGRPFETLDASIRHSDGDGRDEPVASVGAGRQVHGAADERRTGDAGRPTGASEQQVAEWLERWSVIDKAALLLALPASVTWPLTDGMSVVRSRTGRVKNVLTSDGRHILSPRLIDGGLSLTLEGARVLHSLRSAPPPTGFAEPIRFVGEDSSGRADCSEEMALGTPWLVIEPGAVPFVGDGRNVIHGFIRAADPHVSPGLSCLVVDVNGGLVAEGVAMSTAFEMAGFKKGVAVKVRNGAVRSEAAPSGD